MTNIRVRVVAAWALSILLFLTYMTTVAPPKLMGDPGWLQRFEEWGYSPRFASGIGMVELIAAALLLIRERGRSTQTVTCGTFQDSAVKQAIGACGEHERKNVLGSG